MASIEGNSNITTERVSCSPSSTSTLCASRGDFSPKPGHERNDRLAVLLVLGFVLNRGLDNKIGWHGRPLFFSGQVSVKVLRSAVHETQRKTFFRLCRVEPPAGRGITPATSASGARGP